MDEVEREAVRVARDTKGKDRVAVEAARLQAEELKREARDEARRAIAEAIEQAETEAKTKADSLVEKIVQDAEAKMAVELAEVCAFMAICLRWWLPSTIYAWIDFHDAGLMT